MSATVMQVREWILKFKIVKSFNLKFNNRSYPLYGCKISGYKKFNIFNH